MSTSVINESRFNSRGRNQSGGSRTSSPGRGPRSEGGYSAALSHKSTDSKKNRSSTYPKKGSTLGNIDLSEEDQAHLNDVLERFDRFRQMEERRIRELQSELVEKQKVRIRNAEASGDGHCYNCGRLFMAVFNTPTECHICRHEFCRMCLEKMPKSKDLICKFCRFESVTRGQTGVWFMEELKKARAAGRVRGVSGPEALRSSLMRIKRESRANSLMQQIANPLSDQDLDNSCSDEPSHISVDESDNRSLEDEDVDIHTRAIRLSTASTYTHKADSPVSIRPLTASTALCARNGKCCFDLDDPIDLELTDPGDEVTPIRSTSKGLCSCESDMKTPDSAELSGHLNHSETVLDPVGSDAEALLRAKRSFRRVRCQLPAESSQGFPDGSDSDYTQPSTQKWVESHHSPQTAGSDTGQNRPQDRSPSIGARSSSTKPGSLISDSYSPSASESHRSRVPSGPNMSNSLSDLRDPNGVLSRHQARLTSEAGSKSTLSLASDASAESNEDIDGVRETEERLIEKRTLQTLNNALPASELAQTRRRSRTLTEQEFKDLFCRPLDELVARGQPKPMTGSMRSLRHINSSRFAPLLHSRGSMLSIYSERESSYTHGIKITGDLRLDIQYDHQSSTLRIAVKQARDLAIADKKNQSCNPYVKSYLLPDKTKASKRKTSHKKHTRNPVYEEEIKYRISYSDLSERSLQIAVWHKPGVGTNLFLGEVIIPFADFQFDTGAQWYPLSERRQGAVPSSLQIYRGELLLALKLVPGGTLGNQSELHVWIKSAKGLTTSSSGASKSASVDPYAKIYLLPERDKNSKRKTKTLKKTNNPDWNTNFVYKNINRNRLAEIGIEVSVWDHDRFSTNDFLGGCRLNNGSFSQRWMDATGTEQSVWLAMMERPQTWFEGLIRLRPNLD